MNEEQNQPPMTTPEVDHTDPVITDRTEPTPSGSAESKVFGGLLLGIVGLLLLFIFGGLFVWFSALMGDDAAMVAETLTRPTAEQNNEPESTTAEAAVETAGALSTSDELDPIEADLEATMLDIDADLAAIDAELEAEAAVPQQ
jgi:hypothetical protein